MREIDLTNDEDEEFIGLAGMEAVVAVVIDLTNDDDTEVDENGDIGPGNGEANVVVVAPLDVVAIDDVPAPAPAVPAVDPPRRRKKRMLLDDSSDEDGGNGGSPSKQLRGGWVKMDDVAVGVGGGLSTGHGLSPITMATNGGLAIDDDLSVGERDFMNRFANGVHANVDTSHLRKHSCEGCGTVCAGRKCDPTKCPCKLNHVACHHGTTGRSMCCGTPHLMHATRVQRGAVDYLDPPRNSGLFAAGTTIPPRGFIIEYTGALLTSDEAHDGRPDDQLVDLNNGEGHVIDGAWGNEARFLNSSCAPNAVLESWQMADGSHRVYVFALDDPISPGTEITVRYNWKGDTTFCRCGRTSACAQHQVRGL